MSTSDHRFRHLRKLLEHQIVIENKERQRLFFVQQQQSADVRRRSEHTRRMLED